MNRRQFFKASVAAAGIGTAAVMTAPLEAKAAGVSTVAGVDLSKVGIRRHPVEKFDEMYKIPKEVKSSHSMGASAFGRSAAQEPGYEASFDFMKNSVTPIEGKPGYDYKDFAIYQNRLFQYETTFYTLHKAAPLTGKRYEFKSKDEANDFLKRAGYFVGADEVGIAPYDHRFSYQVGLEAFAKWKEEVGFVPKSVVVMAIVMNREVMKLSPLTVANGASFQAYSQSMLKSRQVAQMINNLGYHAVPDLEQFGLSIPYGVLAGLGEQGRNGLLINPRLGMNFRLIKVYTDMEATPDGIIDFGVANFCKTCLKCADNCPSDAVSRASEPSLANPNSTCSNNSYPHWAVDGAKCLGFWTSNHCDCARCMMACPYTKEENWLHQGVRIAAGTIPGMDKVARNLDDAFGYGKDPLQNLEESSRKFWSTKPENIWEK